MFKTADQVFNLTSADLGFRNVQRRCSTQRGLRTEQPFDRAIAISLEQFQRTSKNPSGTKELFSSRARVRGHRA